MPEEYQVVDTESNENSLFPRDFQGPFGRDFRAGGGFASRILRDFWLERGMDDFEPLRDNKVSLVDDSLDVSAPGNLQVGAQRDKSGGDGPDVEVVDFYDSWDLG
jgi:hypothetical protein